MGKRKAFDRERLGRVLQEQDYVISRKQALSCWIPRRTLDHWVAPGGRWQRVLPGVYAAVTGTLTPRQRYMAALLYAGPRSVITGCAALRLHRLYPDGSAARDVLVADQVKRQSVGFVRIHRTIRMPEEPYETDRVKFASPARAAADAARFFTKLDDVRDVISKVVQRRACDVAELIAELHAGPSAGSLLLSAALTELADGVRSVAEGDLRKLVLASALPVPMFNAKLYTLDGDFIAMVDAWWDDAGVAAEVDSRAYHISPADQDRDAARHGRLTELGVLVHHFSPQRIKADGDTLTANLAGAIANGRNRPRLPIIARQVDSPVSHSAK
jgi:hypothetical protein